MTELERVKLISVLKIVAIKYVNTGRSASAIRTIEKIQKLDRGQA